MMKTLIHKADTRGHFNYGWLDTHHTFSFADYYNQERMHFGVLRVLNDDIVKGGKGFDMHSHENMEIISIPVKGNLEHKDSTGTLHTIGKNEVQIMSAGKGITHSEYNKSKTKPVNFLQIWIYPNTKDVEPRYDQMVFSPKKNKFQQIISPYPEDEGMWIHQKAWLDLGYFEKERNIKYNFRKEGNGVYMFVINGKIQVNELHLTERDGIGILGINSFSFRVQKNSELLLLEIPMAV